MRYCMVMPRPIVLCAAMCAWVCGCATAPPATQTSALERAVAEDEDLGDPRVMTPEDRAARDAREQARAQAMLDDPSVTRLDFDGDEENDAPVDRVSIPPDRSPSSSLMDQVIMGPSS